LVAAADVLIDEDELFGEEEGRGAERIAVLIDAVGRDGVGRALEENRVGFAVGDDVLGDVDGGEEADAVAHGDAVLVFRVLFADGGDLRGQRQGEEEAEEAHGS
jgi:hypothetical protein